MTLRRTSTATNAAAIPDALRFVAAVSEGAPESRSRRAAIW